MPQPPTIEPATALIRKTFSNEPRSESDSFGAYRRLNTRLRHENCSSDTSNTAMDDNADESSEETYNIILGLRYVSDSMFGDWLPRVSELIEQVGIMRKMDEVSKLIRQGETLSVRSINPNIKNLSKDNDEDCKHRWLALAKLDCPTIIFCVLSVPALMSLPVARFDWLVRIIPGFVKKQNLPHTWITREQIRITLANTPRRQNTCSFIQGYHDLEVKISTDISNGVICEPEPKRRRTDQDDNKTELLTAEQSSDTGPVNEQLPIARRRGIADDVIDEPEVKRRRTNKDDTKLKLPTAEQSSDTGPVNEQARPEVEFAFSQAPIEKISLLRDLIPEGIESSKLYVGERQRQEKRTGCIHVFIRPRDADGSIIITSSSRTCHDVRHALGLEDIYTK